MRNKKIGITGGLLPPDSKRNIFIKKELCYTEKDFANFWASFGVLPVLIPNLDKPYLDHFLSQLDGLALMGGTDIAPQRYGETALQNWHGDSLRDHYEWTILDWFVDKKMPVFGICRGFQLLNVYFGGSLYQDLPSQAASNIVHADKSLYDLNLHAIHLEKGALFDNLQLTKESNMVNSLHHQGVKRLADGLQALAYAEDGLVEAFYHTAYPEGKIMAVQWHPEFFYKAPQKLMDSRKMIEHFLSFL